MLSRRCFLTSAFGFGAAAALAKGESVGPVEARGVVGYRVVLRERYPYPPGLRQRMEGRVFKSPGEAIKAFGRRHHPCQLMPITFSEAKERPVQVRDNVGIKSQKPPLH